MNIDFSKVIFKDFENIPNLDIYKRSEAHEEYLNYRLLATSGCDPEIELLEN